MTKSIWKHKNGFFLCSGTETLTYRIYVILDCRGAPTSIVNNRLRTSRSVSFVNYQSRVYVHVFLRATILYDGKALKAKFRNNLCDLSLVGSIRQSRELRDSLAA